MSRLLTRDFLLVFSAQFTLSSTFNCLLPTIPIYLAQQGSTENEIGIMVGAINISSLVLRPLVGRGLLRTPEKTFMEIGASLFVLTSIAYLFAPPFWPLLIVRILQGVGVAFFYTSSVTLVTTITPEDHRAQSLGYFYLAFNFAFALAPSLRDLRHEFVQLHHPLPVLRRLIPGGSSSHVPAPDEAGGTPSGIFVTA